MSQQKGTQAEILVRDYLIHQGLLWVTSNYRTRLGEIDIIMQDGATLVFVEVRSRQNSTFGDGIDSVTYAKRQKLLRTATQYAQYTRYNGQMRFDVVGVLNGKIEWIKNAFGACA